MKRNLAVLAIVGVTAALSAGCVAHAQASGSAEAESAPVVFEGTPTLILVDSGVWVVRDHARAVYYVDEYYWVYRDGKWYRSQAYDSGWAVVEVAVVPGVIVHRDHKLFVNYHGEATAQTRPAPRPGEATAADTQKNPPGHDAIPGVGNQRKAEGEQPGHATHTGAPAKTDSASGDAPGVGNQRKAEGTQPGKVGQGGTPSPAATNKPKTDDKDKKDDKKK